MRGGAATASLPRREPPPSVTSGDFSRREPGRSPMPRGARGAIFRSPGFSGPAARATRVEASLKRPAARA
jgi:hypothetical protein